MAQKGRFTATHAEQGATVRQIVKKLVRSMLRHQMSGNIISNLRRCTSGNCILKVTLRTGKGGVKTVYRRDRSTKDGGLHTAGRKNTGDTKGGRGAEGHEEGRKKCRRNA
eukprot:3503724-Heterocapsa_arctica.AAC.1